MIALIPFWKFWNMIHPDGVHAFTARTVPDIYDKDVLTLTQAMKLEEE